VIALRALVPLLLLAACSGPATVYVSKQPGLDGAWAVASEKNPVRLEAKGTTATLQYGGRTLVFPDLGTFHGHIGEESVRLLGRRIEVRVDPATLLIRDGDQRHSWKLADQPRGKTMVYASGRLTFR
jgi:hypothetical protein